LPLAREIPHWAIRASARNLEAIFIFGFHILNDIILALVARKIH
jgi:hypothetical protein